MRCYGCGKIITKDMMFCPECGKPQGFDSDIMCRARNGEQDAITELYNRTYDGVYQTVRAMVKDEDTALDLLQDSYIKAFKNLEQLKDPNKFCAWVKRIAHNRTVDYLRKAKPVMFSEMVSADSDEMVEFADERISSMPDAVIDRNETARLVSAILDELPDNQRAVTIMYYFDDVPISEIATQMGVSESTVKSQLNYARQKIKTKVEALEKQGTKLYGLAPIPFLIFLFRGMEAQAAEIPSQAVLYAIQSECVSPVASSAGGTTSGGAVAATTATAVPIKAIVIACVGLAGAAAVAGGVAIGISAHRTSESIESVADDEDGIEIADILETEAETETEIEDDINGIFIEKLDEIVAEKGVFDDSQSADVIWWENSDWLDCSGVMSATILDFDCDGQDEMLVCIAENLETNETYCDIDLYMWEIEDGDAVLADTFNNGKMPAKAIWERIMMYHALPTEDGCYILCESRTGLDPHDVGMVNSYWIVEYADGALQDVAYINSPGGYGEDARGIEYEKGVEVSSQVYYNAMAAEGEALYDNFDDAITAFFGKYGIQISTANTGTTNTGSVYAPMLDDAELILDFQNIMTDWIETNVSEEWDFETTLTRGNDLLDGYDGTVSVDSTDTDVISNSNENTTWQEAYSEVLKNLSAWLEENYVETDSSWVTTDFLSEDSLECEYACLDWGNDETPELILRAYSEKRTANYWFFIAYDEANGAYIVDQNRLNFRVNLVLWDGALSWSEYNSYNGESSLSEIALEGSEIVYTGKSATVNWENDDSLPETEALTYYSLDDASGIDEY